MSESLSKFRDEFYSDILRTEGFVYLIALPPLVYIVAGVLRFTESPSFLMLLLTAIGVGIFLDTVKLVYKRTVFTQAVQSIDDDNIVDIELADVSQRLARLPIIDGLVGGIKYWLGAIIIAGPIMLRQELTPFIIGNFVMLTVGVGVILMPFYYLRSENFALKFIAAINEKMGVDESSDVQPFGIKLLVTAIIVMIGVVIHMLILINLAKADMFSGSVFSLEFLLLVAESLTIGTATVYIYIQNLQFSLGEISGRLSEIAEGEGDLTRRLPIYSADEIGNISHRFNGFVNTIQEMIIQIKANSSDVNIASNNISIASDSLATGAEEQQAQLSEVATTMEQMSAMILDASRTADTTQASATESGKTAIEGREIVSKTVAGMETVVDTVEHASTQIRELSQRSEEIGSVIKVIDDIADQTNLLALNANIEAARAGDAGRGFAVVADEVRKLAERTVTATAEIGKMIESIQADIQGAVTSMSNIQEQSNAGLELVQQSDGSLKIIAETVEGVSTAVETIATSASEQSSGAEEISKNIEGITTVSRDSATQAQELANMASSLAVNVDKLNSLVERFRVE